MPVQNFWPFAPTDVEEAFVEMNAGAKKYE
jgi:hypothetical protein